MNRLRPAHVAWAAIGIGVSAYELLAPQGETLSEGFDTIMDSKLKYAAMGAVAITALHICNQIPEKYDPFEQGLSRIRQAYKGRA